MIKYRLSKDRKFLPVNTDEDIFYGDNKISQIYIDLPDKIDNYEASACTFELVAELEGDWCITYPITIAEPKIDITTDITDRVQTVNFRMVIKYNGDVIGTTNSRSKEILPINEQRELVSRADFDRIIREQRETIAEQSETITNQGETITQQGEQITELNGEVTELTTENTRLENLTETQRQTIQNMIDNPPAPELYTPPVVTPSGQIQQINPLTGYDGLTNAVVDRVTAEVDINIQPENIKKDVEILGVEGTYDPFPYNSVGGIYITEVDEAYGYPKSLVLFNPVWIPLSILTSTAETKLKQSLYSVVFKNCPLLESIPSNFLQGYSRLRILELPVNLKTIGTDFCRSTAIEEIQIPRGLVSFGARFFYQNVSLKTINFPNTLTTGIDFSDATYFSPVLEFITLEHGINVNMNFSCSTLYSHDTILSWFNALADRTGETAYTLTIGATNIAKMTAEEIAIATNKNWNLA